MSSQIKELYIDCPSCLRRNNSDMNFCMYCCTALKPEVEVKRVTDLNMLVPCIKCGKTDGLSKDFCVYCGNRLEVPGTSNPDTSAYKKFSWELERIEQLDDVAPKAQTPVRQTSASKGFNWTILLAFVGVVCGGVMSYFLGRESLEKIYLQLSWPKEGIVVYVEPKNVSYILQDSKGQEYLVGKSASNGSFSIQDVKPGKYRLKLSSPGFRTILQNVNVRDKRTSVLGYPNRIRLPAKKSS